MLSSFSFICLLSSRFSFSSLLFSSPICVASLCLHHFVYLTFSATILQLLLQKFVNFFLSFSLSLRFCFFVVIVILISQLCRTIWPYLRPVGQLLAACLTLNFFSPPAQSPPLSSSLLSRCLCLCLCLWQPTDRQISAQISKWTAKCRTRSQSQSWSQSRSRSQSRSTVEQEVRLGKASQGEGSWVLVICIKRFHSWALPGCKSRRLHG